MPTNETVTEVLKITAEGIDAVTARLQVYADQVKAVEDRQKALQGLINDPIYTKYAERIEVVNRAYEQGAALLRNRTYAVAAESGTLARHAGVMGALNRSYDIMAAKVRNQIAAEDLASGATTRHSAAMTGLNRQLQAIQARGKIGALSDDLKSGAFMKAAQEASQLNREMGALQKEAQFQTAVAEHGRFGAVLRVNQRELAFLGNTARGAFGSVMGFGMGLMHMGLQGTLEGEMLNQAWMRVGRQVAGIAIPALSMASRIIGAVATSMSRLDGTTQRWILGLGLAALALGPILRGFQAISMTVQAIRLVSMTGLSLMGLRGAGTAAGIGGAGAAGSALGPAAMARLGGSAAGAAGASAAGAGAAVAGARVAGSSMAGRIAHGGRTSGAGIAMGLATGPLAPAAILAYGAYEGGVGSDTEGTYYHSLRHHGHSKVRAGLEATGAGIMEGLYGLAGSGDEFKKSFYRTRGWDMPGGAPKPPGKPPERTDVHSMNTELLEGGGSAGLVSQAVLKSLGGGEGGREETVGDLITFLKGEFLNMLFGRSESTPPRVDG